MTNFFYRLFGAKKSNSEKHNEFISAEQLTQALFNDDIDTILLYLQQGGDVNVELSYETAWGSIQDDATITVAARPLDIAQRHSPDIAAFLKRRGARLQSHFNEIEKQKREERAKQYELKDAEAKTKHEAYIRQRIAAFES